MPYRRCPRCGVSSYVAPQHARISACPYCERPFGHPSADKDDPVGEDRTDEAEAEAETSTAAR